MNEKNYKTLRVNWRAEETICVIQLYRPDNKNTINNQLIEECSAVLNHYADQAKIIILEGLPDVFCFGADFQALMQNDLGEQQAFLDAELMYNLWLKLTQGNFISIAHVRGQANAGGVGFVAACDLVLADDKAVFSLSELLFGLMPACVLPFLIRKIGYQKAHALTLLTKPVTVVEAAKWGLVDAYEANSQLLLNKHLLRLRRLNKTAIERYKDYMNSLDTSLNTHKVKALAANQQVFSDVNNLNKIKTYVETGQFPWE